MPVYDTQDQSGRYAIKLKALSLAGQDFELYGPVERTNQEIVARAQYHIACLQNQLPTPEAILADDLDRFTALVIEQYTITYNGLFAAYTGIKSFKDGVQPTRYTTSAAFVDEEELDFTGLVELCSIIRKEQSLRREAASEDHADPSDYLASLVQVTVHDAQEPSVDIPRQFVCYTLEGEQIKGIHTQEGVSDHILLGLGLLTAEAFARA
jgi:hypothetical protein